MASGKKVAHRFGGVWTEIKLKALTEYLQFYRNALKNKGFETWYVDAFAGTGDRHAEMESGGIFDGGPIEHFERILDGSARKALKIAPPFDHYWFTEQHGGRAATLTALQKEFPYDISIRTGEANAELRQLFTAPPWSGTHKSGKQRGVVFLDPYGMSVNWDTLQLLADTERVDVWYLFPRKAVIQQLARDISGVDDGKRRKLDQIFGMKDWEEAFYKSKPAQSSLFDLQPTSSKYRSASPEEISEFARQTLKSIFTYVSQPLPLIVNNNRFFELYCLSNNKRAINLITKGVNHVIKKYSSASHYMPFH